MMLSVHTFQPSKKREKNNNNAKEIVLKTASELLIQTTNTNHRIEILRSNKITVNKKFAFLQLMYEVNICEFLLKRFESIDTH